MMAYGPDPSGESMELRCWGRIPFKVIEETAERLASTASELALVTQLMRGCMGSKRMAVLGEIADDLHKHLGIYCRELDIGPPGAEPETTTKGAPVTEVAVDASAGPSKCARCGLTCACADSAHGKD